MASHGTPAEDWYEHVVASEAEYKERAINSEKYRTYRFGMALVPLTQVQWRLCRRHADAQMPG